MGAGVDARGRWREWSRGRQGARAELGLLGINAASTPLGAALFNVLPLFALRLGAGAGTLGVLNALMWVSDILQWLAVPTMSRFPLQRWFSRWLLAAATAFSGLLLLPLLPSRFGPGAILVALAAVVTAYNVCLSLGFTAYSPYIRRVIPLSVTGEFLGKATAVINGGQLASTVVAGLVLGSHPAAWRFYLFFGLAACSAFARAAIAWRLPPTESTPLPDRPQLAALLGPLRDPASRRYALVIMALTALWSMPVPLFTPYLSLSLGLPDGAVVLARAGTLLAPFVFGHAIGRLVDRAGFHLPLAGSLFLGALSSVALAFLPRAAPSLALTLLGAVALGSYGLGNAAANTALGKERFARARHPYESEFLGLTNAGVGLGAALGSVTGGLLPGAWVAITGAPEPYRPVLLLLAAVGALAGVVTAVGGRQRAARTDS